MNRPAKKVLLVCYYFPPLGMGGVGRPLSLFRQLPEFGWDCHVLTVKPVAYRAYEPELLEELDARRIFRSGSRDPQRLLYLLGRRRIKAATIERSRAMSDKFFPDSKVGWLKPAVKLAGRLIAEHGYQAIVTTSPPVSCHLIGRELAERYRIPWVADFRDFWTSYRIEDTYRSEDFRTRAHELLASIERSASGIAAASEVIGQYVSANHIIPNGYLSEYAEAWKQPPDSERFTIGILGHQFEKRPPGFLLRVLESMGKREPSAAQRMRVIQVGQVDDAWFRGLFAERGLPVDVVCYGQRGRAETVRLMARAHVHYLDAAGYDTEGFLPGRTFDLIASGRPILAHAKSDGALGKLLKDYGSSGGRAECFAGDTVDSSVEWLETLWREFGSGGLMITPLGEFARRFSSTEMVRRFAEMLDGVA